MATIVALDIGSSSVAGAELRSSKGRVTLSKAAVEPLSPGLVRDGEIVNPGALALELRRFWRAERFSGKRVRLGVANQRVVVRIIEIPALDDPEERRSAARYEAAEQIPMPPESTVVDLQPVMRFSTEAGARERVVAVVAHREMVQALAGVVRRAGLVPTAIDLESFAILRALLPPPPVVDEGSPDTPARAVCHVGAQITNMMIAVDRRCHFTRMVGFGGTQLTAAVSERTGLPTAEAESLKVASGLLGEQVVGHDPAVVGDVREALAVAARPLAREIERSLEYYRSQSFSRPVDRLVLSGGTSLCAGLDRYLAQALNIPVQRGNPLTWLHGAPQIDVALAARAAVAVGLALDEPDAA